MPNKKLTIIEMRKEKVNHEKWISGTHSQGDGKPDLKYSKGSPYSSGGLGYHSRQDRINELEKLIKEAEKKVVATKEKSEKISSVPTSTQRPTTDYNRGTMYSSGRGYCSWGWFEDSILNTHFGFVANKEGKLQTKHRSYIRSFSTLPKKENEVRSGLDLNSPNTCRFSSKYLYTINKDIILPHKHYPLPKIDDEFFSTYDITSKSKEDYEILSKTHAAINDFFDPFKHPTKTDKDGNELGIIRNFVFSADYLTKHFAGGVRNLESALNSFWNRVSSVYGGYWNFEIVQSQNTNGRISVIDRNVTVNKVPNVSCFPVIGNKSTPEHPNKNFEFSVYSKNSLMTDFTVDVNLDSKLITQAVYHTNKDVVITGNTGMNSPESLGIKALSLLNNVSVTQEEIDEFGKIQDKNDSLLKEITTPYLQGKIAYAEGSLYGPLKADAFKYREEDVVKSEIATAKEDAETRIRERDTIRKLHSENWWVDEGEKNKQLVYLPDGDMFKGLQRGMLYYLNKSTESSKNVEPIVPLSVSFTINGIGGIRIGDCFAIDYLPETYRKFSAFQVSKVDHTVGTEGWKTSITGILRVDIDALEKLGNSREDAEEKKPLVFDEAVTKWWISAAEPKRKKKLTAAEKVNEKFKGGLRAL